MTPYNSFNVFTDTITGSKGTYNVMVYLPADYQTKQYPCFYFFNGRGEDTGGVAALAKWGPLAMISASFQPQFIALAVQAVGWDNQQNAIYTTLKARYNFGKVVLTGISEGGWVATAIMGGINMPSCTEPGANNPVQKDVVAFIPMSAQIDSSIYTPAVVSTIAASGVPVLGFGDDPGDIYGINTHNLIKALVAANPSGNYTFINTPGTGHGGWDTDYSPSSTQVNGGNIYDWASKVIAPPVSTPLPVVTPPPVTTPPATPTLIATVQVYSDGSIKKI